MIKSQRWFVVALLFLAGVINYLDRSALSIAAPLIQKDLNFSHAQMGVVFSSFFVGYALFNFVGDPINNMVGQDTSLADRERLRRLDLAVLDG